MFGFHFWVFILVLKFMRGAGNGMTGKIKATKSYKDIKGRHRSFSSCDDNNRGIFPVL